MKQVAYNIKNLKQEYANKNVLDISSLDIQKDEILGIAGSNGSGKSTLLRHLAYLETPKSGEILYKNSKKPSLELKREISILLPEPYLLKRSVRDNLFFGLKIRNDKKDVENRAKEVLNLVGLLPSKFLHRQWYELSSGETQRLALASRLILKPNVLLLDEPTNSLDFIGVPLFTNAIKYANEILGTTIVIATHDLTWLSSLATRKIVLHFGKIIDFSTANLLLDKWTQIDNSLIFTFFDNQKIVITKRDINQKRGLVINPRDIVIKNNKESNDDISLRATIKEVSFLQSSNEFSIKLSVGAHIFECIKSYEDFQKDRLYPTQNVFINFKEKSLVEI